MQKRLACLLTVLVVGLAHRAVHAQAPDFAEAKRHYMGAREAQGKGDYDTAVREYISAYNITKDPVLFKSIAASYEAKGNKQEAAVYYRRYLNEVPNAADANDVRAKVVALEAAMAPPPPASRPVEKPPTPPAPVPAKPPAPPPAVTPPPEVTPALSEEPSRWGRTAGWISVGAAAVLLTTGSVLATSALSRKEDLERLVDFRDASGLPERYAGNVKQDYEDKSDQGDSLNTYSMVAFIGAGACAALAVTFFIVNAASGPDEVPPAAAPKAQAKLAPFVGPHEAGLFAGWEF